MVPTTPPVKPTVAAKVTPKTTTTKATSKKAPKTTPTAKPASKAPTGSVPWPAFGRYVVGEKVQFLLSTGWRTGTLSEVGVPGTGATDRAEVYERKYRIVDDRYADAGNWYDWGSVAGLAREQFWTGFFVGDWKLGEVMAVNTQVKGNVEETEFSYGTATDALRVSADGTYRWKPLGGREIVGRWTAAPDGPGVVLQRGVGGANWTFRNETNATEENIRALQTAPDDTGQDEHRSQAPPALNGETGTCPATAYIGPGAD